LNIFIFVWLIASSFIALAAAPVPKIKADDFQRLAGAQWTGALTYLDYSKNKKVSIPSRLTVTRSATDKLSWVFDYEYPDEPQANEKENVAIGKDGKTINDTTMVERTILADKTLKIVTEKAGIDNDRRALFRYTYLIGAQSFSLKKEVRYEGVGEFFERNEYSWKR
jgi:hypothetical protein